ncbi:MAG: amidohydrolase family protein [Clostridia bacterium]|nr:amidohydrolase family protein [Clostridia bacterium]
MVIDFHTHCFPEKIAKNTLSKLSFVSGGLIPQTDGTKDSLLYLMSKDGIDKSVVLSIATNANQQRKVNDFALSLESEKLIPFGSVFPFSEDWEGELERLKSEGVKGIKLHPDYQQFFVDDERLVPIYKKIEKLGFILVFHAGEDFGFAPPYHATPERLRKVVQLIETPVVCAHWGSLSMGDDVLKYLCDIPCYFDTAFGYGTMPKERALRILEKKGTNKILFGSDSPWNAPSWDVGMLKTMGLTEDEENKIFYKNAEKLLGI